MKKLEKRRAGDLKGNPHQLRKNRSEEEIRALGRSVITKQIHPLVIRPDGTIVDGDGRWLGVMMCDPNHELECIVTDEDLTPAQCVEIQLVTALQRSGLTPYEQHLGCKNWREMNPSGSVQELAQKIGRDPATVTKLLSLAHCVSEVVEAAAVGLIGLSDWYALSKAPEAEQRELLALKRTGGVKNRDALQRQVQARANGAPTERKAERVKIPHASGTVVVKGKDLGIAEVADILAGLAKDARKAAGQMELKTWIAMLADRHKGEQP